MILLLFFTLELLNPTYPPRVIWRDEITIEEYQDQTEWEIEIKEEKDKIPLDKIGF